MKSTVNKATIDEMHILTIHFQSEVFLSSISTRHRKNRVEAYKRYTFTSEIKTKRIFKIDMKAINTKFLITLIVVLFSAITEVSAQTVVTNEIVSEENAQEMIQENAVEMSSIEISNWFSGAKQETKVSTAKEESTTINRSSLVSKKEQYLKSGMSTKTILIRSIMKKADSYVNATV